MKIELNRVFVIAGLFLALSSCSPPKQETETISDSDELPGKNINPDEGGIKVSKINLGLEISSFIPDNYSILDSVRGDLNLDKIPDLIIVLKKNGEDSLSDVIDHPEKRPLMILIQDNNGKFKRAKRNDNTVYCVDCGGVMGDPYAGITIKDGYFSVEHYGGSSWRWTRVITYKYSKEVNDWFLHKDGSESFHASDPEKIESKIKTKKDFGKVKFDQFDIYKENN